MYNKFSHTAIKLGQITARTGLCHRRGTAHNHGHHLLQSSPANCRDKDTWEPIKSQKASTNSYNW